MLLSRARPDPPLEGTRTGMAIGTPAGVVHHPSGEPSAKPALGPLLERQAARCSPWVDTVETRVVRSS